MPRGVRDLPPEPDRSNLADWLDWRCRYSSDHLGTMAEIGKQVVALRRDLTETQDVLRELARALVDDGR